MKRFVRLAVALVALATLTGANAQSAFPTKPVRLVVAFAPGGVADILARLVAQGMGESLGQQVIVENRPGAGGNVATRYVAKAAPDGYTILVNTNAFAINPSLSKEAGYDPKADLVPVTVIASSPTLLVASPGMNVSSLKDVVQAAKSGKLNYATAGPGTPPHLAAEYFFKALAKVPVTHVPFNGAGPALTATVGNQVELASVAMPSALAMVKSGKVRPIAVTSKSRTTQLPDVPTFAESGYPALQDVTWVGLFAPAGTPPEIVDRIGQEAAKALERPEVKERLGALAYDPVGSSPKVFREFLDTELEKWATVVKEIGPQQ